jgi:hypothetical protein
MAAAFAAVASDPPGRILSGIAAVGLLVFAAGSWRARPRLALSGDGLTYRGWLTTRRFRPAEVESVRTTEFRRLGRKVRLLEIETVDDTLLVLSRWDLGGDPGAVLDALVAAGYPEEFRRS